MSRTCRQKSPFTSRTRPPTFRAGSLARYASSCSTYGYRQADVLPVPMAPMMAMPGVEAAFRNDEPARLGRARRRGAVMLLAEHQKEVLARLRRRIGRQRLAGRRRDPIARKDVEQRERDVQHEERRAEPQRRVRVGEAGVDDRPLGLDQPRTRFSAGNGHAWSPSTPTTPLSARLQHEAMLDARAASAIASVADVGTRWRAGGRDVDDAWLAVRGVGRLLGAPRRRNSRSFAIVVSIS